MKYCEHQEREGCSICDAKYAVEAIINQFEFTNDSLWTSASLLKSLAEQTRNTVDWHYADAMLGLYEKNKSSIEKARKLLRK